MPIHEYVLPDGSKVERLFMHGEVVPNEVYFDGVWGKKTISMPVVKFASPMSGGTTSRDLVHKDDGSVIEAGTREDVKRRKAEKQAKKEADRKQHIASSLASYDV